MIFETADKFPKFTIKLKNYNFNSKNE